jgi:hypothetical protein
MKAVKMSFIALAILAGVGGALVTKANKAFATYYVIADQGTNWRVQTAPVTCPGGDTPCQIQSNATPDQNGEIPKSSVTLVQSHRAAF